ncbi:hypothetical protein M413DRAFT_192449 [Hebeloma cylindrosporum]|uniref:Uncharacterized protein n=1 Tax=Hebeloma cylindrosporum TaxID=76867 RepID=A0A0C3BS26_HEBCY|nr:hypothetical protein M413DRAFT_192449 [Hebeloma cylindrosporum h7]
MAVPRIIIPCNTSTLPTCTPNLMPFHIDYTGPANVSKFMKIDKVKLEELVVEERKEPLLKDGDLASAVDGADVPMDTDADAPGTGTGEPKPLKRAATDVEMHDSMTSVPTAGADSDMQISIATATTTTTMLLLSRTESTIIESQTTTSSTLAASSSSSSSNSLSPGPTTATAYATPTTLLEDADKRFVSTFRGRTIHGLTIDLPPGYGGLVLRREGNDALNAGTGGPAAVDVHANGKGKGRAEANGKTHSAEAMGKGKEERQQQSKKPPPRRGRLTRSATLSKPEVITIEEEPAQDQDEDETMADPTPTSGDDGDVANGEIPNEHPVRRLIPHAQFSSFTLWHQDRPVDKGRDEYCRTLTEWIALAHEVHRTDL